MELSFEHKSNEDLMSICCGLWENMIYEITKLGLLLFPLFIMLRRARFEMSWELFAKKLGLVYHHKWFFDYKIYGVFRNHHIALEVEISGFDGGVASSLSVDASNPRGISMYIGPKFVKLRRGHHPFPLRSNGWHDRPSALYYITCMPYSSNHQS